MFAVAKENEMSTDELGHGMTSEDVEQFRAPRADMQVAKSERPQVVLVNRCFVKGDDGRLLVIKRSPTDRNHASKWEVPGGKVDKGQDLSHAQEREVMEETGLLAEPMIKVVFADSFVIGDGQYAGMTYVVLFSITKVLGGHLKISEEHTDHAWVNYDELLSRDLTPEVRKAAIVLKPYLA